MSLTPRGVLPRAAWKSQSGLQNFVLGDKCRVKAQEIKDLLAEATKDGYSIGSLASFAWVGEYTLVLVKNGTASAFAVPGGLLVRRAATTVMWDVEPNATNAGATPFDSRLVWGIQLFPIAAGEYGWALSLENGDVVPVRAAAASATYLATTVSASDSSPADKNGIEASASTAGTSRTILGLGMDNSTSAGDLIRLYVQKG